MPWSYELTIQGSVIKLRKLKSSSQFLFLITGYGRWGGGEEGLQELLKGRDQAWLIFFFQGPASESSTCVGIGSGINFESLYFSWLLVGRYPYYSAYLRTLPLALWPVPFTREPTCYLRTIGLLLIIFKLSNLNKESWLILNSWIVSFSFSFFFGLECLYQCQLMFCFYYFNFYYRMLFFILLFLFFTLFYTVCIANLSYSHRHTSVSIEEG